MTDTRLEDLENRLLLVFADKALLQQALVHRSLLNEKDKSIDSNERLEFLGDAVVSLVVAEHLFQLFPEQTEGGLTDLRSALVRRETLSKWATRFGLGDFLLLGKGEASTGGRTRPANLAGAFEAVLGALYLDKGLEITRDWLMPLVREELSEVLREQRHLNFKTRLQIETQRRYHEAPVYMVVETRGSEHEPEFVVEVLVMGTVLGRGIGSSKQQAQQEAARVAFQHFITE
jgi:ribonuclease-3